jgi:hypothetical protein
MHLTWSLAFRLIDFGDQESERKKWVQCFSTADAVVFCAALSDYDTIDHDGSPKVGDDVYVLGSRLRQ